MNIKQIQFITVSIPKLTHAPALKYIVINLMDYSDKLLSDHILAGVKKKDIPLPILAVTKSDGKLQWLIDSNSGLDDINMDYIKTTLRGIQIDEYDMWNLLDIQIEDSFSADWMIIQL